MPAERLKYIFLIEKIEETLNWKAYRDALIIDKAGIATVTNWAKRLFMQQFIMIWIKRSNEIWAVK